MDAGAGGRYTPRSIMAHSPPTGALHGIRILDLTTVVMGPFATLLLGDLGADVVKVESPSGDNMRHIGPMRHPGMGHMFLNANRNKRSIVLDLKQPAARDVLLRLAAESDVLVCNVRPRAMQRLGLGYEDIRAVNERIVHVAAVGYGEGGPYSGKPAYDDLIQGMVALPSLAVAAGADEPRYVPLTIADRAVGQQVALAVCAALVARGRTGCGQYIEIPMFETMAQFLLGDHLSGRTFDPPLGDAGYQRLLATERKPYRTADGHLCVLIYNDKHWQAFFALIGRPDLLADPRFRSHSERAAHIDAVYAFVAETMRTRTSAEWLAALEQADIPAMPLNDIDHLIDDPHLVASGFFQTTEHPSEGRLRTMRPAGSWSETPPSVRRPPPRFGEHTIEILREAGYDDDAISSLIAARAAIAMDAGNARAEF